MTKKVPLNNTNDDPIFALIDMLYCRDPDLNSAIEDLAITYSYKSVFMDHPRYENINRAILKGLENE